MLFRKVAETFSQLEAISERIKMVEILSELFRNAEGKDIQRLVYLLLGRVAPEYTGIELGIGEKTAIVAISRAYGVRREDVEREYKDIGDLGKVAETLCSRKTQMSLFTEELTLDTVYSNFYKIATLEGEGSNEVRTRLLMDLLSNASPLEARYIVRMSLGKLRLGIGDATILEAAALAFLGDRQKKAILEDAYNVCSDLGYVVSKLVLEGEHGLRAVKVTVGIPVRPALAQRATSAGEIFSRLGRCAVEAKYDGFRCQIHKKGGRVWIFSRRLENMTGMFPELVKGAKEEIAAEEAVIEGEAIAYNEVTHEFYPFQLTIQRKRKYGVYKMAEEFPLKLFAFDVIYKDGVDLRNECYEERRKVLEEIVVGGENFFLSERRIADSAEDIERFFEECVERGLEGIIAKDLKSPYIAGARKWAWIKLKRSYRGELSDTLDVVIVGYYKGRGNRARFGIGGILVAVYDDEKDVFKTIAKVGTGFTEKQLEDLRDLLDGIRIPRKHARVVSNIDADVWVEPVYVITVSADEITKSPLHTCAWDGSRGLALRFPRIAGWIRADKKPEDATTEKEVVQMYDSQSKVVSE